MKKCPGFGDLFRAARGRDMAADEADRFNHLSQAAKNDIVKRLVQQTNGAFRCYDVVGSDGQTYTAFDRV